MAWKPKSLFNVQTGSTPTVQASSKHSIKIPGEAEGAHADEPTVGIKQIIPGALIRTLGIQNSGVITNKFFTTYQNNFNSGTLYTINLNTQLKAALGTSLTGSILVGSVRGNFPNIAPGFIEFSFQGQNACVPVAQISGSGFCITIVDYLTADASTYPSLLFQHNTGVVQPAVTLRITIFNLLK